MGKHEVSLNSASVSWNVTGFPWELPIHRLNENRGINDTAVGSKFFFRVRFQQQWTVKNGELLSQIQTFAIITTKLRNSQQITYILNTAYWSLEQITGEAINYILQAPDMLGFYQIWA